MCFLALCREYIVRNVTFFGLCESSFYTGLQLSVAIKTIAIALAGSNLYLQGSETAG